VLTGVWIDDEETWVIGEVGFLTRVSADGTLEAFQLPSPQTDPDALIRIGRLPAPLAISVTREGLVRRWDLSTGEVTAEVPMDTLPLYGHATPDGERLVWRDPPSTALNILNFETGENRMIIPLNGMYVPFIFLTASADVIIGVDPDEEPVVVAWVAERGERIDLGQYRACGRPPDMARLSEDGSTLVIGCDAGLDIWRVAPGEDENG
jgi:hypothetical protein